MVASEENTTVSLLSWFAYLIGVLVVGTAFMSLYFLLMAVPAVYLVGPDVDSVNSTICWISIIAGYPTAIYLLRDRLPDSKSPRES
jgi:hypothetical protein